jgi:hypothetical protein
MQSPTPRTTRPAVQATGDLRLRAEIRWRCRSAPSIPSSSSRGQELQGRLSGAVDEDGRRTQLILGGQEPARPRRPGGPLGASGPAEVGGVVLTSQPVDSRAACQLRTDGVRRGLRAPRAGCSMGATDPRETKWIARNSVPASSEPLDDVMALLADFNIDVPEETPRCRASSRRPR